ncbi:MAG: flagellar export chaperone FliS [Epulopiscium sp. Nele67-Bin005]|nr:MAG: flagellar export chaperone FliS [Epulopiscium sp. Nele67-Bin005]
MYNPYNQYQSNAVMTSSPGELTLMLYNGAIKFINLGIEAIEKKNISAAHTNIVKAQNIISELRATLDEKYEISKQMDALYEYVYDTLLQANMHKDVEKLQDALKIVREFRDMWQEVLKKTKTQ